MGNRQAHEAHEQADEQADDCLLWIDGPYKTIEAFVEEAATRGVCRTVNAWPPWAIPGKTRVFLAHHDDNERVDFGSIFGYFDLTGVALTPSPDGPGDGFDDRRPPISTSPPGPDETREPPGPTGDGQAERRRPAKPSGGYQLDEDELELEPERICGDRLKESPVYFVDALARAIDQMFAAEVREARRKGDVSLAAERFDDVVARAAAMPELRAQVPSELTQHAEPVGAFVLLRKPYPRFQRFPRAWFRNFLRIDGEELRRRIVAFYRSPHPAPVLELPYFHAAGAGVKAAERTFAELAEGEHTTKHLPEDVWDSLARMLAAELSERERVTLPHVGTFQVADADGDMRLEFKPSKTLRDNIRIG